MSWKQSLNVAATQLLTYVNPSGSILSCSRSLRYTSNGSLKCSIIMNNTNITLDLTELVLLIHHDDGCFSFCDLHVVLIVHVRLQLEELQLAILFREFLDNGSLRCERVTYEYRFHELHCLSPI